MDRFEILKSFTVEKAAEYFGVSARTINRWRAKENIRIRRTYTEEEKREAVILGKRIGCTKAARVLGIDKRSVSDWINKEQMRRRQKWNKSS